MAEESRQLGFDTKAVKLGYTPDVSSNYSLIHPVGLSSTFEQDDPSSHRVSDHSLTTGVKHRREIMIVFVAGIVKTTL